LIGQNFIVAFALFDHAFDFCHAEIAGYNQPATRPRASTQRAAIVSNDTTSSLRCPKCGKNLVRDEGSDMMRCLAHGPVGNFHQLAKAEIGDILREIRQSLDDAFDGDA
jgi:predicted RNA-binding Zn-ribbon protein involved in translation (DUF1610 family)